MKKQTLVATLGTLALAANVLLPGLAFGQQQTGTADVTCSTTAPAFTVTPAAAFTFYPDGSSGTIYSSSSQQQAFNNPNGAALGNSAGTDYLQVNDVRDPSAAGCNNGLTLTVAVQDGSDGDGCYFDAAPTTGVGPCADDFIPLNDLYVVSSNDGCPAGTTAGASGICFDSSALCGAGDGNVATACAGTEGSTGVDYAGTSFATLATYTTDGAAFGTANTPNVTPTSVFAFADGTELFGEAGVATSYAVDIDAGTQTGTYVVEILYTLTGL